MYRQSAGKTPRSRANTAAAVIAAAAAIAIALAGCAKRGGNDETTADALVNASVYSDIATDPITEPVETDPPVTDPAETDPPETDPAETDPAETDPPETDPPETDPPETEPPEPDPVKRCVNATDGYALTVPRDAVIDSSMSEVVTVISYGGVRLRIYREITGDGSDGYISYSNSFLKESRGVTLVESGELTVAGFPAVRNIWTRRPLSLIENDKNKYACYDVKCGGSVITMMFKFDDTADLERDIIPVAESLEVLGDPSPHTPTKLGARPGPALDAEASALYERLFSDSASLTWGVFTPYMTDPQAVRSLEESIDFEFPIYVFYSGFNVGGDGKPIVLGVRLYELLTSTCPAGKTPLLTLQTYPQDTDLMIYDVLDGKYDQFLHDYAADVASYGRPVLFRLCNEMNADWCTYCALETCRDTELFISFYRYVFSVFKAEGADNAIWVFNPNSRSFPDYKWNSELCYYPGDEYVNVVGMTAYNTGTYYKGESWHTFDELYSELVKTYSIRYDRPLMIPEFACSGIGGDKAAWIDDMFAAMPRYGQIKVAVWWNHCDYDSADPEHKIVARPYMLDETPETTAAFRRGIAAYKPQP